MFVFSMFLLYIGISCTYWLNNKECLENIPLLTLSVSYFKEIPSIYAF